MHEVILVGAHARLALTKEHWERFDEGLQTTVTWDSPHEEFVVEGPDGRLVSASLRPDLGSKAEATAFARRVNEAAQAVSAVPLHAG